MKTNTSVTLDDDVLRRMDEFTSEYRSRSQFVTAAVEHFIRHRDRPAAEQRDLAILNLRADALNEEAVDVLSYQSSPSMAGDGDIGSRLTRGRSNLLAMLMIASVPWLPLPTAVGVADSPSLAKTNVSVDTVESLLAQLSQKPEEWLFLRIAELGTNARSAGPALVDYLRATDWDARLHAARTLGYIGYTNAGPCLVELLNNADDWRLVHVSAESLGRLRVKAAIPALISISQTHWFPPVRKAATNAMAAIAGTAHCESGRDSSWFVFEFLEYQNAAVEERAASVGGSSWRDGLVELHRMLGVPHLPMLGLRYTITERTFSPEKIGSPHREHIGTRRVMPDVSLRVDNGHIVGRDMGEFGGELMFIGQNGKQDLLLAENTVGIHGTTDGILAVTGLAHMLSNKGVLYRVAKDGHAWRAHAWKALPGAPRCSQLLPGGNLFVACQGGSVVVSPGGDIRIADENVQQAVRDQMVRSGALSVLFLSGGFVVILFCGLLILLPYCRGLPSRFLLLAVGVLPFAFVIGGVVFPFFRCGWGAFVSAILGTAALSLLTVVRSVRGVVKNNGRTRRQRYAYFCLDALYAGAILWALGVCAMARAILCGMK